CCSWGRRRAFSEICDQREPEAARFDGVEVYVWTSFNTLSFEARCVVVVDVARFLIEQTEHIERDPRVLVDLVACAQVGEGRRVRADAVVLLERPWPEVAHLELPEPGTEFRYRRAEGGDLVDRARDVVAHWIVLREPRVRRRQIEVEEQPGTCDVMVVPLD